MRLRLRQLVPFALALLALVLLVPSGVAHAGPASARFKSPRPIERNITDQMVMDSSGAAHLVGINLAGDLVYRSIPKGGSPSAPVTLVAAQPDNRVEYVALAIDGSDRLHLLFTTGNGTLAYTARPAGGSFAAPLMISQSLLNLYTITLAVEPSGRAHIAWTEANGDGQVARITDGQLAAPTNIGEARITQSAVDGAGTLHIAYYKTDPANSNNDLILYAKVTLAGAISQPLELGFHEDNGSVNFVEELLAAPDGSAHLLLGTFDDSSDPGTANYMLVRPDGTTTTTPIGPYFGRTKGVLDQKGRIHVIWIAALDPPAGSWDYGRELRYGIFKNGAFEKGRTYAKDIDAVFEMAIAMGPNNKPTVVWAQRDLDGNLAVVARRPGSTTPRILFKDATDQLYGLLLATNPQGGAVTSWQYDLQQEGRYASTYR